MTNQIIQTKDQLIINLNEAQQGFIESANTVMDYAFQMGEILIKLKEITPPDQAPNPSIDPITELPSEPDETETLQNTIHEMQSQIDYLTAENDQMHIVVDDDNHIAAAVKEIKRLTELNCVLNERINGLMSERNDAIKSPPFLKLVYTETAAFWQCFFMFSISVCLKPHS